MYKNRAGTRNNICGEQIRQLREQMVPRTSQRKFADMLQLYGVDLDKNAVQRIESGSRFHAPEAMARLGLRQGMIIVFKNRAPGGANNISGRMIKYYRLKKSPRTSQRMLAEKLQLQGLDIGKNAVQQIESGARFVTDIELKVFAKVLGVSADELLMEPPVY